MQGCSEIRWLAEKMGAKPATVSGLSGLGDIMLTCYGALSRNRSVGVRLGRGEALQDIIASSLQVPCSCMYNEVNEDNVQTSPGLCTEHVSLRVSQLRVARKSCLGDRSAGWGRARRVTRLVGSQVAEGVTTAGVVVGLGQRYRVALPVLTAVAQVLDGNLSPREAVWEIMNLPQIEEK